MRRKTDNIEFVESNNLRASLARINKKSGDEGWRRALYHAILALNTYHPSERMRMIREALGLP